MSGRDLRGFITSHRADDLGKSSQTYCSPYLFISSAHSDVSRQQVFAQLRMSDAEIVVLFQTLI